jgi:hypothetical protein
MWKSGKNPPKVRTSKLPPSERVLLWAKDDRQKNRTQFHEWESHWTSNVRRKAVAPVVEAAPEKPNPSVPAWMNYRAKPTKQAPLYFRTKPTPAKKST